MNPIQPPPPMTYQHLQVENEYLKHNLSYAQHVGTYNQSVAQANFHDAQRWRKFKEMLSVKQGAEKIDQLEKHVDAALTKALELLIAGQSLNKYDLAKAAPCNQRTAQRVLDKLHNSKVGVRIIWWAQVYHRHIPIYHMSHGSDYPQPVAMTPAEQQRRLRAKKGWEK